MSDRLAELGATVPIAQQRARECEIAHRELVAEITQLTDSIADAYANSDETLAADLSKQRAAREDAGRQAGERLEGARRAVSRAEAERGLYTAENFDGLLRERSEEATAVALAAEQAVERLGQAHAAWSAMEQEISGLLRLAGRDTRSLPRFPAQLEDLVRNARRAGGVSVPSPLPGGHGVAPIPDRRRDCGPVLS